ncbi:MAG: ABC transporter ATP-binding protein/permease [Treponema sp.]|nr:ABC transporter ATP-binding protein/permease [Treponema sp.]
MLEPNKTYSSRAILVFLFQAAPFSTAIRLILTLIRPLLPTVVFALATASFVDTAIAVLSGSLSGDRIYLPLLILLLSLGAMTTIDGFFELLNSRLSLKLQAKLQAAMVRIHAGLDYKHIERAETWELISRTTREPVQSIMRGFYGTFMMVEIIIRVASVLVLIITQVFWAALVITAFSVPLFWLSYRAGRLNYQAGVEAEKFKRRTEYLDEVLTSREGTDERSLFGFSGYLGKIWYDQYEASRKLQLRVHLRMFLITKGSSIGLALIALLIALTLINPVLSGDMSPGMYMGIISAVFGMIQALGWNLSFALEEISRLREYMKDLSAFCALSGNGAYLVQPDAQSDTFHSLEFRKVRFTYPGGSKAILDGLSFKLDAGKSYALVGPNGAGKTTITRLLTGLYGDYEGEIFINDRELRDYSPGALKALFSVVYQDYGRYFVSLEDNLALGDQGSLGDQSVHNHPLKITEVSAQAGLEDIIKELPQGLANPLGKIKENGQDLSGGQWQKVAIGRSLMSGSPVKVLDEPSSALDPLSESRLYEDYGQLMAGKTTILISHRLGSTKLADRILVLRNGALAEEGSHNELMDQQGLYSEMFEAQRSWYQ